MTITDAQPTSEAMAERLATLYEINQAINSSLELDVVMEAVMDKVIEVTRAQRGFLMLGDEAGQLHIAVARGLNKEDLQKPDFQYSTTIVKQVVETGAPLLTSNAEHDPRFKAGQSIVALGLRSILCVPINVKGRLIGLVYVDNSLKAGVFKESDLALLNSFAAIAGIALENARLHRIAVQNARLERELSMAYEIQRSMLPSRLPTLPGYQIAAHWRSAREVAGDFYDVFALDGDRLGVVIADVADKGVGAALFMAVARSLIRGNAIAAPTPMDTIQQTNHLMLLEESQSGMFVTVYYTIFQPGGHGVGVNAGHNLPMLYHHRSRQIELLPRGGWALGWFDDVPLTPCAITLEPGDTLLYYTDGLTEAEDAQGAYFGADRLANVLRREAGAGLSAQAIVERINTAVDAFVGDAPPFDDLTLVVVRYTGENG
jgi:sigma-B regulation protein RsbU (phosphoserine phosphatase)